MRKSFKWSFPPKFTMFLLCTITALTINKIFHFFNFSFPKERISVICVRVIDGDTITVKSGIKKLNVRFIGIDTPEINWNNKRLSQKGAFAALSFLRNEIEGKIVFLEPEQPFVDRYNRVLAYVYKNDDTLLNASIVRKGYGRVFRRYPCKKTDEFLNLENKAKSDGIGIWINTNK